MNHGHPHHEHGRRFTRGGPRGREHDFHHGRDPADAHGRDGRSRGGQRSSRLFAHGELRLVVLALIAWPQLLTLQRAPGAARGRPGGPTRASGGGAGPP